MFSSVWQRQGVGCDDNYVKVCRVTCKATVYTATRSLGRTIVCMGLVEFLTPMLFLCLFLCLSRPSCLCQVSNDSLANCIVSATYSVISTGAKAGKSAATALTDTNSIVKVYEAAYDNCAPQARRRSLQQAGFFSRMTEEQYTARQALFRATAQVGAINRLYTLSRVLLMGNCRWVSDIEMIRVARVCNTQQQCVPDACLQVVVEAHPCCELPQLPRCELPAVIPHWPPAVRTLVVLQCHHGAERPLPQLLALE